MANFVLGIHVDDLKETGSSAGRHVSSLVNSTPEFDGALTSDGSSRKFDLCGRGPGRDVKGVAEFPLNNRAAAEVGRLGFRFKVASEDNSGRGVSGLGIFEG